MKLIDIRNRISQIEILLKKLKDNDNGDYTFRK